MAPLYGATPRGLTTSASASFPVHALTWLPGGTPPRARTLCTSRDRLDARDDARSRGRRRGSSCSFNQLGKARQEGRGHPRSEQKSTRLNSSHTVISYAVFCLKKKKKNYI